MISSAWRRSWWGRACWFVLFYVVAATAHAEGSDTRVLQGVDIVAGEATSEIRVNLSVPMRYVTHAPLAEGDELVIRLQLIPTPGFDPTNIRSREAAVVDRSQPVPLQEVTYEAGDVTNPTLTLRFSRTTAFTVRGGEDFRSVVVTIPAVAPRPAPPAPRAKIPLPAPDDSPVGKIPPPPEAETAELLREAREAMTSGDYNKAIRLATKLLLYHEHPQRREAQELLGLARERKGQLAHAKAEYEEYLRRYPEGEGAQRVQQRLSALLTAGMRPEESLREARADTAAGAATPRKRMETEFFGSFSQYYYRDTTTPQDEETQPIRSSLVTDINVNSRHTSDTLDVRTRFTGGYEYDFLEGGENSESRLSDAFVEVRSKRAGYAFKLGRQSRSTGGVQGRFDGAVLSYQVKPTIRINGVVGYPVESTRDTSVNTGRYFYNASVDFGPYKKSLNFDVYYLNQTIDDISDREAAGAEMRYFKNGLSVFGLLDYDLLYDEVNTAILLGNWTVSPKTTFNLTLDYRQSPALATLNALQGQPVESISELRHLYTDDEIMQLARDRTAESKMVNAGFTYQVNDKYQIASDLTVSDVSETQTSGGVEGGPATGTEYYYQAQLVGTNVFTAGDVSVIGLRYDDTSTAERYGLRLNTRFPWRSAWRINPRAEFYLRNKDSGAQEQTARVQGRIEYRWKRTRTFETEFGYEWIRDEDTTGERFTTTGFLFYAGYRIDF